MYFPFDKKIPLSDETIYLDSKWQFYEKIHPLMWAKTSHATLVYVCLCVCVYFCIFGAGAASPRRYHGWFMYKINVREFSYNILWLLKICFVYVRMFTEKNVEISFLFMNLWYLFDYQHMLTFFKWFSPWTSHSNWHTFFFKFVSSLGCRYNLSMAHLEVQLRASIWSIWSIWL